jgi:hypothetical protein
MINVWHLSTLMHAHIEAEATFVVQHHSTITMAVNTRITDSKVEDFVCIFQKKIIIYKETKSYSVRI